MSVLWQRKYYNKQYEVRQAGASLRLYTNGAFHSQYNPDHLFTYAIWDLLTVPVLFRQSDNRSGAALLLGVGGGTAIHQLNRLVSPREIVGIELDAVHLTVARRFFGADQANVTLIEGNAVTWLSRCRRKFDIIIDDIFVDTRGDPERPTPVDEAWLNRLGRCTSASGVVVQNHLSPRIARALVSQHEKILRQHFSTALVLTTPNYENGMLALYKKPVNAGSGRRKALAHIASVDTRAARRLKFQCRQLY